MQLTRVQRIDAAVIALFSIAEVGYMNSHHRLNARLECARFDNNEAMVAVTEAVLYRVSLFEHVRTNRLDHSRAIR